MRFYTTQHPYDCGIDRHARTMYVCILDQAGDTLLHRHRHATPEALLKAIAPDHEPIVMAAECMFTWYWLADLCAEPGIPVVLGHALDMKALPGGKAKHDTIDAHNIAVLRRGGMLPPASVDPAERRATHDLRRRRLHLARHRGALLAHGQHTTSQDHLPAIGHKIADQTNRDGVAERCADPAGQQSIDVDRARLGSDDARLRDVERTLVNTATHHEAQTLYLLHTGPGLGQIRSLVQLDEIHQLDRFPRVPDFASSGRLVTCAQASAGQRSGTSGTNIGKAHLTGAFSEAAVFCWRDHPAGQQLLASLAHKPRQGTAVTILAPTLARAVYDLFKHKTAVEMQKLLTGNGRGVGELDASRDDQGMPLTRDARHETHDTRTTASLNADERIGHSP